MDQQRDQNPQGGFPPQSGYSAQDPRQLQREEMREAIKSLQSGNLSAEERKVLNECSRESFWYRSLPASLTAMIGTHLAVVRGILKPSPRFGSTPKAIGFGTIAYFIGKFTYGPICREKVLREIPNSRLAMTLRQAQNIPNPPEMEMPQTQEEDSSVSEVFLSADDQGQVQEKKLTYDDLRKKHREEAGKSHFASPTVPPARQPSPPQQPSSYYDNQVIPDTRQGDPNYAPPSKLRRAQNKYGDEGFE